MSNVFKHYVLAVNETSNPFPEQIIVGLKGNDDRSKKYYSEEYVNRLQHKVDELLDLTRDRNVNITAWNNN